MYLCLRFPNIPCSYFHQEMLFEEIQEGVFEFPEQQWSRISENAKNLISQMLVRDPRFRYSANEILEHPWINEPAPATCLATPKVLSRNSSSQLLDTYAEKAMAFNRLILSQLTISESRTSSSSTCSSQGSNPFFSPSTTHDSDSATFFIGQFSEDEDEAGSEEHHTLPAAKESLTVKLSLPSSKLAQRRQSRQI